MKSMVVVLALLVSVTGHGKEKRKNEMHCQVDVCKELRELKVQLQQNKFLTEQLKTQNDALKERLTLTENSVTNIMKQQANRSAVAFSAGSGYNGYFGPFDTDVVMAFSTVLTNIGDAYSPNTGVFEAPVKGVYHFTFTVCGFNSTHFIGAIFFKNQQAYFQAQAFPEERHESVTRSISLVLEPGDQVYLKLQEDYQLYDDENIFNTFDGFLILPL